MSLEAAIYDRLRGQPAIASKVGTRIYPSGQVPGNTPLPMLTQEISSGSRDGLLNGRCALMNYQVAVTGAAESQATLRALMDAVQESLDVWRDGRVNFSRLTGKSTTANPELPELFMESHTYSVWFVNEI